MSQQMISLCRPMLYVQPWILISEIRMTYIFSVLIWLLPCFNFDFTPLLFRFVSEDPFVGQFTSVWSLLMKQQKRHPRKHPAYHKRREMDHHGYNRACVRSVPWLFTMSEVRMVSWAQYRLAVAIFAADDDSAPLAIVITKKILRLRRSFVAQAQRWTASHLFFFSQEKNRRERCAIFPKMRRSQPAYYRRASRLSYEQL